jgi:hypothetical protein
MPLASACPISLPLLEPGAHIHFAIHCPSAGEILSGIIRLSNAAIEFTETAVAMSDKRAHAVSFGEPQCLFVGGCAVFGIEAIVTGCYIAEKSMCVRREARLAPRGFKGAIAEAARVIEPAQQQTGVA